jgi:hypothetical protein
MGDEAFSHDLRRSTRRSRAGSKRILVSCWLGFTDMIVLTWNMQSGAASRQPQPHHYPPFFEELSPPPDEQNGKNGILT